jgi:hypothetical protein
VGAVIVPTSSIYKKIEGFFFGIIPNIINHGYPMDRSPILGAVTAK